MNKLPAHKRRQVLHLLVEGSSMRAAARIADCSKKTVTKLMLDAGTVAAQFHNDHVRKLKVRRVECDELWAFCYTRTRKLQDAIDPPPEAGDIWTYTAIDPESKLLISYFVGQREAQDSLEFMEDVSSRLATRIQLTTDGWVGYRDAVDIAFAGQVDYAQLVKNAHDPEIYTRKAPLIGDPDPSSSALPSWSE